ncbi:MAG: DNA repair protein RadC [Cytophagales bacterium]|nr:DNA repair protein RadC [Cytophagales bacterium]
MQNNNLTIKKWAPEDRPREKLLSKGKKNLSNAELIAILLGSGTKSLSALDVARNILQENSNSLNELAQLGIAGLKQFKGIGEAKAVTIVSALELGRRRKPEDRRLRPRLMTADETYDFMKADLQDLKHEEFWVILLRRNHEVINKYLVSSGGVSGTLVDPKLIFKRAVDELAAAVILVHNHPSGNRRPSQADVRLTRKIQEAGKLLDVSVLDHLIFTDEAFFSFSDEKMMCY